MKNRKLKGLILAVVLTFTLNSSVIAADNRAVDNIVSEDSGGYMSYDEFANQNMLQNNTVEVVEENEILNLGDKNQNDTFSEEIINLEPNMCLDNEMDNTSANYPLDIDSYESINGQLTETNENRWFRLQVQDSNRLAVLLLMDGTLDSDLYIYKLNPELMQIALVGGSNAEGNGQLEYADLSVDEGIYYILVFNSSGSGNFILNCYTPAKDYSSANNTMESAKDFGDSTSISITDSISVPADFKYYKFEVKRSDFYRYRISIPDNIDYSLLISPDNGKNFYTMEKGAYLTPGTHIIRVAQRDITKCSRESFKISVSKAYLKDGLDVCLYTSDFTNFLQYDHANEECYVNGNRVMCHYDYEEQIDLGGPNYNDIFMNVDRTEDTFYNLQQATPAFVDYSSQWLAEKYGKGQYSNVLLIPVAGVYCKVRAYGMTPFNLESDIAELIIDPNTGGIIDINFPNFYYERGNFRRYAIHLNTNVYLFNLERGKAWI